MILLSGTLESITLQTLSAGSVDYVVSCVDMDGTSFNPIAFSGTLTSATTFTIVPAPAAGVTRQIKHMAITNNGVHNTLFLKKTTSAGSRQLFTNQFTLRNQCSLQYAPERGFMLEFPNGMASARSPIMRRDGQLHHFYRPGVTAEAAGVPTWPYSVSGGAPGPWTIGTPGLAGRVCNNTDVGAYRLPDSVSGKVRIDEIFVQTQLSGIARIIDVLWVNTDIVVTTTTAQTVNSVAFPARDLDASANGNGVMVGLLCTTSNTNAAAIVNMTMSYTNQDGTAGRTATMPSWPATAVLGSFLPFALQAGDRGVRSIQSITLGTSLGAGSVSLVAYRVLGSNPTADWANAGLMAVPTYGVETQGIELFDTSCMMIIYNPTATSASAVMGEYLVTEI